MGIVGVSIICRQMVAIHELELMIYNVFFGHVYISLQSLNLTSEKTSVIVQCIIELQKHNYTSLFSRACVGKSLWHLHSQLMNYISRHCLLLLHTSLAQQT